MAKSFSHRDHWQLRQLKKLQRQEAKKLAYDPNKSPLSAFDPAGSGIMPIPSAEELRAAIIPKETRTEPIVALRVWNVQKVNGKPYLRSTFKSEFVWPYRKALEQDICSDAGIHAVKPKKDWDEFYPDPTSLTYYGFGGGLMTVEKLAQHYKAEVMGEVYLWGRVQEHACGYLAQFAYPKRLWVSPKMDVLTWMELEYEYGVPCDTHDALDPEKWVKETDDIFSYMSSINRQFFTYQTFAPPVPKKDTLCTAHLIQNCSVCVQKADNSKSAGV